MGQQAKCTARFAGKVSAGTAYLESVELDFRGDFRLRVPFKDVAAVAARRGKLSVRFPKGVASFELGPLAEKWALKIRYPRGLMDKLGVKPDSKVAVLGLEEASFWKDLRARTPTISRGKAPKGCDLVFLAAEQKKDLGRLKTLRAAIHPAGAIWVVWPKGQKALTEDDVRNLGPQAGLVDVKVASFSETLSALKLVIPLSLR